MAEKVEFGDMSSSLKGRAKGKFLYISPDSSITVRFVGHQEKAYVEWDLENKKVIFHENKKQGHSTRIISLVIDRDDGAIRAFGCPTTVFAQMGEYGPKHDFKISRSGHGLSTRYHVESFGETKVSEEDENKVEATLKTFSLTDIFVKKVKWSVVDVEPEPIVSRFDILDL